MKKGLIAIALLAATSVFASVGLWQNDKAHSQLQFTVAHMGVSDVSGMINDFDVTVSASEADFSDAVFELTAQVASIDTRVEARDNHLRSADFFDAENHPLITYKSTGIAKVRENDYKLTGDLTIRGVTRTVEMDLRYVGSTINPMSNEETVGFQLTGEIKRSDFGVGNDFPAPFISDEVWIKADGEFTRK